jgi:hypothetical protein
MVALHLRVEVVALCLRVEVVALCLRVGVVALNPWVAASLNHLSSYECDFYAIHLFVSFYSILLKISKPYRYVKQLS